jgi:hypothetical protein
MTGELREKLKLLPDKPGCYLMRDRCGRIIDKKSLFGTPRSASALMGRNMLEPVWRSEFMAITCQK